MMMFMNSKALGTEDLFRMIDRCSDEQLISICSVALRTELPADVAALFEEIATEYEGTGVMPSGGRERLIEAMHGTVAPKTN